MPRRVICISSEPGAGGERIGRLVAERLRLRYVDEQIVLRAAAEGGVSPEDVVDAERRRPFLERLLSGISSASLAGEAPEPSGDEDRNRQLIGAAVRATADEGNVVIVAHAASVALGAQPGVLRVLVTASPETRERRVAEETGSADARRLVRAGEAGRASYLKTFYGVDRELPTHYDIVVNTDTLGDDDAAAVVTAAAER